MKNLLIPILVSIALFTSASIDAQVRFIPGGGVNFSKMTLRVPDASITPDLLVSYHFGGLVEIPLSQGFVLHSAVLYSVKGSEYSIRYREYVHEFTMAPAFAELHLYGAYRINVGKVKLLFRGGPYAAYAVGGQFTDKTEERDLCFGEGDDCDMKSLDYGLGIGAGIDVNNFLISMQYELGMINLAPVEDSEMKISVLGFSVGYFFGAK